MHTRRAAGYNAIFPAPSSLFPGTFKVGLFVEANTLKGIDFLSSRTGAKKADSKFAQRVVDQIEAYFSDAGLSFDVPMELSGTAFQQRVWQVMRSIPAGKVMTYGEVAHRLNSSARAVGNACRANPIPIIVPCHRIVAANGLGGFMGHRDGEELDIKQTLLRHEGYLSHV